MKILFSTANSEFLITRKCRHSHGGADQVFSRVSVKLGKTPCSTVEKFEDAVKNSYTPTPNLIPIHRTLNIKEWLAGSVAKHHDGVSLPRQFVYSKGHGGSSTDGGVTASVRCSEWSDSELGPRAYPLQRLPEAPPRYNANRQVFSRWDANNGKSRTPPDICEQRFEKAVDQIYSFLEMEFEFKSWDKWIGIIRSWEQLPEADYDGWWPLSESDVLRAVETLKPLEQTDSQKIRDQVQLDAIKRQAANQRRIWIGYQCSDTALRHRNVLPKDAKRGNIVLLDCRNADNPEEALLGDWDGSYQLATVVTRHKSDSLSAETEAAGKSKKRKRQASSTDSLPKPDGSDDVLDLLMWEPYYVDPSSGEFRPLWVENEQRRMSGEERLPTDWKNVVQMPWRPITQLPLSVVRAIRVDPYFRPSEKFLLSNYLNSAKDCEKMDKGYRQQQKAGTVRYVFQFEKNERRKNTFQLQSSTQQEILRHLGAMEAEASSLNEDSAAYYYE